MKAFLMLMLLTISLISSAQVDSIYSSTDVQNTIYSMDFLLSKNKVLSFIQENNIKIQNQKESKKNLEIQFVLNTDQYNKYNLLVLEIGNPTSKKVNTTSNYNKILEINLEINYLKNKSDSYKTLLSTIDDKSASYLTLWNEQKLLDEKIFNKERELIKINNSDNKYNVTLEVMDEITFSENTGVSFVNMPGFEYSILNIESPKFGISFKNYQGYFIKYLFTKGKSYAKIGAFKSNATSSVDTSAFTEMFILGFGQDFYSRHLGRGTRKFLNLYSGYTIGGILATGATNKSEIAYISPSIGIELFKNKYILIDTKVDYFLPLSNNRNLRGINYSASFNFVF